MFERDSFTFYENGVVSLNIPMAKDVIGARATRTTYPKAVRGFERIFSAVLDRRITIETPFRWTTRREVVQLIGEHGLAHMIAKAVNRYDTAYHDDHAAKDAGISRVLKQSSMIRAQICRRSPGRSVASCWTRSRI